MIDIPIFVIYMPQRETRIREHLSKFPINPFYFPSIDGKKMGLSTTNPYLRDHDLAYWNENPPFFCGPGIQGLSLTNYAIIKTSLAMGFNEVIILEDDIDLKPDWINRYKIMREAMPNDWLVFWGSTCCCTTIRLFRPDISLAKGYPLCTPFMSYSRKAMEIIEENAVLGPPWDVFLYDNFCMKSPDQCYIAHPDQLASQLSIDGKLPTTLS